MNMKLKEALEKGYISKIGKYWYAEGVNLSCDTPYEALKDWKKKQEENKKKREEKIEIFNKSPEGLYWNALTYEKKMKIRRNFCEIPDSDMDLYTFAYQYYGPERNHQ